MQRDQVRHVFLFWRRLALRPRSRAEFAFGSWLPERVQRNRGQRREHTPRGVSRGLFALLLILDPLLPSEAVSLTHFRAQLGFHLLQLHTCIIEALALHFELAYGSLRIEDLSLDVAEE